MIAAPLNDRECLAKLTQVAADGQGRSDLREVAGRFRSTVDLAAWIRGLRQRDDDGDPVDGPRVTCDVPQRVRLVADDPNCVERSVLYLAAAEMLDPRPVRQLATIETTCGRHTFPVEDGRPVVLNPRMSRNGLTAGVWMIRNGGTCGCADNVPIDPPELLSWLADIAEEVAERGDGERGLARVGRARRVFGVLLDGGEVSARDRSDALYAMRAAGEGAPLFGEQGALGLRVARAALARLLATAPPRPRNLNVDLGEVGYWAGKTVATAMGVGVLYDPVYEAATGKRTGAPPSPPVGPAPPSLVSKRVVTPVPLVADDDAAESAADLAGSLNALALKGG